ncbi:MAG: hypothetical protein BV457_05960 [Thermoplasmata archaeon M9B1D]|nr:MAG: hypothetical protein BV457_05960 [Thermoplasmata archaeon M9B1D]PNX51720.1 MAG: hypothetical protein BV456_02105 [Thermoplasmata archaeon M8B2D]
MSGKISGFLTELKLSLSIVLTIIGFLLFLIGMNYISDVFDIFGLPKEILEWSIFLLIVGFIILVTGIYYLYTYLKDRKFILEELETNKRSEIIKKHSELQKAVKHMPSKYKKMLEDKEEECKIK